MATRTRSDAQLFTHDNYNATGTAATKTLPKNTTSIFVHNMDGTNTLLISFDGGTKFLTIGLLGSINLDCDNLASYKIKSSAGTVAVECLYASEA